MYFSVKKLRYLKELEILYRNNPKVINAKGHKDKFRSLSSLLNDLISSKIEINYESFTYRELV